MQEPTEVGTEPHDTVSRAAARHATRSVSADAVETWSPLDPAARALFAMTGALTGGLIGVIVGIGPAILLRRVLDMDLNPVWFALPPLLGAALGWWLGVRRWRSTHWRFDPDGFALRRGRLWQRETRVPIARVQHLDLKRGPLERRRGLAMLVLHTAGSQASTVSVGGLGLADAEALRDRLMRAPDAVVDDADSHAP